MSKASIEAAARGNSDLRIILKDLLQRVSFQESATGNISSNSQLAQPINPAPPQAKGSTAKLIDGLHHFQIDNPQFLNSGTPGKKRGNLARTPLSHEVLISNDPQFRKTVRRFPIGVQTHYTVPSGHHIRFRSSADGVNFNSWQQLKAE